MDQNKTFSERFLTAYCHIENDLRKVSEANNHESFSYLLDHVAKYHSAYKYFREDLKEFAELRNAIVHKRIGDKPIAEPHPDIVEKIESISNILTRPPLLAEHFCKHVDICYQHDSLVKIVSLMSNGRFNQLPVYNGKKLIGLITSDTIVFWLNQTFKDQIPINQNTIANDLLPYTSDRDQFEISSGQQSIFDAIHKFDQAYKKGKKLKAIIITEDGTKEERPIGIITSLEIPILIQIVNTKANISRTANFSTE